MAFWIHDYTMLFKKDQLQFWPQESMTVAEKLNAVTRAVIVLTVLGFAVTHTLNIVWTGLFTVIAIVLYERGLSGKELFGQMNTPLTTPTPTNPLMNVLLPEINGDPNRPPAATYDETTAVDIMDSVKSMLHDPRIYTGRNNEMELEYSMRNFYTTASTTIPNDQQGFGEFCYGNMPSRKDGTEKLKI
jgi:hypothetical protein